jgi:hypothetical protein
VLIYSQCDRRWPEGRKGFLKLLQALKEVALLCFQQS